MARKPEVSQVLRFIASLEPEEDTEVRLPTLEKLSEVLDIGISKLREQLEVARALGIVKARPRTGIRRQPYSFLPAVSQSLNYAIELDRANFEYFSDLRNHVEAAYWFEAVRSLTAEDHTYLQELMALAWEKLRSPPIRIPHREHRELHLTIFGRISNLFVRGILEAFWEAYEAVGLNLYADYSYLQEVWGYHQRMVDGICSGDHEAGFEALTAHADLLHHHPASFPTDDEGQAFVIPASMS